MSSESPLKGSTENRVKIDRRTRTSQQLIADDAYIDRLDEAEIGEDLRAYDYWLLAVLGVVLPALLLVWGWF